MTVVLVTGVFDVLHKEHVAFLKKAKALGGTLYVGLESDVRVSALKGPTRPVNSEKVRKENIEKLGIADTVFILPEQFSRPEDHRALFKKILSEYFSRFRAQPSPLRKTTVNARNWW